MMCHVILDLKDSKDGTQVMLRGRMFQSFGSATANDFSRWTWQRMVRFYVKAEHSIES